MAKPIPIVALALALAAPAGAALAVTVEDLTANGFIVIRETRVVGDFEGCDRDQHIQLENWKDFVCSGYNYMHAPHPKAVLLKSKEGGRWKLLVNGVAFDGAQATGG